MPKIVGGVIMKEEWSGGVFRAHVEMRGDEVVEALVAMVEDLQDRVKALESQARRSTRAKTRRYAT